MKFTIITNIPAPYRIPIYNKIAAQFKDRFLVIYCAQKEANRAWQLEPFNFEHFYLNENVKAHTDGYNFVHNNPDVIKKLIQFNPDVVITTGYNPTHLYAWLYTVFFQKRHIPMTDGWIYSEKKLSLLHKIMRKIIFLTSKAFIGAGKNSFALFKAYGIKEERITQSHLCIDNERFIKLAPNRQRKYDLMFSGQFIERKLPFFFVDICRRVKEAMPLLKLLILGDGPLKNEFLDRLKQAGLDFDYPGFVSQYQLPEFYSQAKLFLFTTQNDPWGIVANEALASGTPVIVTPWAGVINDLVVDQYNGFILKHDPEIWSQHIIDLLKDQVKLSLYSKNSIQSVKDFNFEAAANGIIEAVQKAYFKKEPGKKRDRG